MPTVFIALGSNINPEENLREAAHMLREHFPDIQFSSVYASAPLEVTDQPDFLNAVARFESNDTPEEMHRILQRIEQTLKKCLPYRFGPRTIDLDLLLYGEEIFSSPNSPTTELRTGSVRSPSLVLPHPRMHERRFVLEPLRELIDASAPHPTLQKTWNDLRQKTTDQGCTKLEITL